MRLRAGLHLGPVKLVKDINGNLNALGEGLSVAQRTMAFAHEPGPRLSLFPRGRRIPSLVHGRLGARSRVRLRRP